MIYDQIFSIIKKTKLLLQQISLFKTSEQVWSYIHYDYQFALYRIYYKYR